MNTKRLFIGAPIIYNHKVHMITNIGTDKVGIVPWNSNKFNYAGNKYYEDVKFVRSSLITPVPISEIIPHDTRFKHAKLKVVDTEISGLAFDLHNFQIFICKDSKFIDVYRVFINSNDFCTRYYDEEGKAVPVVACIPITYMHELIYLLKSLKHSITFKFSE